MALLIGVLWACAAVSAQAVGEVYTPPPFGYYQPILDRMPFGALPANFNAAPVDPATLKNEAQVKAEQQILAKKINMSAVNITPDGQTAIGFTDLSAAPPVNYFLLVGAVAGGWTVVSADYDEETATIEKEGVSITLKLGKGLVDPAAPTVKPGLMAPASPVAAMAGKEVPGPAAAIPSQIKRLSGTPAPALQPPNPAPAAPPQPAVAADTRSYAERQRERAAKQTEAQVAAETKQREQFEKLAREAASNEIKRREEEAAQAAAPADEPQAQQGQAQ